MAFYDVASHICQARGAGLCAEIEVTDGWYGVTARLDPVLTEYLRRGRLFVGQKRLVQGAVGPLTSTWLFAHSVLVYPYTLAASSSQVLARS